MNHKKLVLALKLLDTIHMRSFGMSSWLNPDNNGRVWIEFVPDCAREDTRNKLHAEVYFDDGDLDAAVEKLITAAMEGLEDEWAEAQKSLEITPYNELRDFVQKITLVIQKSRSVTPDQWDGHFKEAYRLYVKHNVEQKTPF